MLSARMRQHQHTLCELQVHVPGLHSCSATWCMRKLCRNIRMCADVRIYTYIFYKYIMEWKRARPAKSAFVLRFWLASNRVFLFLWHCLCVCVLWVCLLFCKLVYSEFLLRCHCQCQSELLLFFCDSDSDSRPAASWWGLGDRNCATTERSESERR
jgi:hypothetical protein